MRPRLNSIINNLSQAIVILNDAGDIVYTTDHIKTILGYDSKELIGKSSFDLLSFNNVERAKLQYNKIIARENLVINSVLRLKHKDGEYAWTELTATNLLHIEQIKGILITANKITGKQKSEQQAIAKIIVEAQEKERHALAGELHDNINQMIAASALMIDTAMNNAQQRELLLSTSSKNLKEVICEIRKLSSSLVSYDLLDFGLTDSVKKFIDKIVLGEQLRITIKMNENIVALMTQEQSLHVFRIIQEQVNNILKHARATKVLIVLSKSCDMIHLKINDNGVGFDIHKSRNGIGISNMIQRAKAMNGVFHITSEKGSGTSIIIRFPV
ncbi:MAG: PAS domain S-box protein [Bacteroidota bacterium]